MDRKEEIGRLIEPAISELGYELVRVQMIAGGQATLQIMAERQDRRPMRVEDCVRLSREISVVLDAGDPSGVYELEVSSPGIDRPLMKRADYERFAGHEARVEIEPPIDGRKRFHGTIVGVENENLLLDAGEGVVAVPFAVIQKGKLVLTDRLLAAARIEAADDTEIADAAA